jgi:Cu(I)/Ag(I) efflux system protein CusF
MKRLIVVLLLAALPIHWTLAETGLSDGEVRRVDKRGKEVTIKHGRLENLDMPPMTMVFRVKDPAMLKRVKAGDKVKFRAELENGVITVVRIEPRGR